MPGCCRARTGQGGGGGAEERAQDEDEDQPANDGLGHDFSPYRRRTGAVPYGQPVASFGNMVGQNGCENTPESRYSSVGRCEMRRNETPDERALCLYILRSVRGWTQQ